MFFLFKIITNNSVLVNYFIIFFQKSVFKNRFFKLFTLLCYFFKPKRKKIFSILKSPHINKKAQQQFKFLTILLTIKIKTFEITPFLFFLKKIIFQLFASFNKVITFLFRKKSIKLLFKVFNPIKFKTDFFVQNNNKRIFLYFKLFYIFGSTLCLN